GGAGHGDCLVGIEAGSGTVRWSRSVSRSNPNEVAPPRVYPDGVIQHHAMLVVGLADYGLFGIDIRSGDAVWDTGLDASGKPAIAVDERGVRALWGDRYVEVETARGVVLRDEVLSVRSASSDPPSMRLRRTADPLGRDLLVGVRDAVLRGDRFYGVNG